MIEIVLGTKTGADQLGHLGTRPQVSGGPCRVGFRKQHQVQLRAGLPAQFRRTTRPSFLPIPSHLTVRGRASPIRAPSTGWHPRQSNSSARYIPLSSFTGLRYSLITNNLQRRAREMKHA